MKFLVKDFEEGFNTFTLNQVYILNFIEYRCHPILAKKHKKSTNHDRDSFLSNAWFKVKPSGADYYKKSWLLLNQ